MASLRSMKSNDHNPSSVAANVRRFRERQRERGLVKREVWIRPEYVAALAAIEKTMREPGQSLGVTEAVSPALAAGEPWTLHTLEQALLASPLVTDGKLDVERLEGAEPSLRLSLREYGDLKLLLALSGEQILVDAYLWPVSAVKDPAAFNVFILQTHKCLPLSSFSVTEVAGVPSYTLFGSLDTASSLSSVLLEIQSVADNVFDVVATCMEADLLIQEVAEDQS